jgi:hypothetical protein
MCLWPHGYWRTVTGSISETLAGTSRAAGLAAHGFSRAEKRPTIPAAIDPIPWGMSDDPVRADTLTNRPIPARETRSVRRRIVPHSDGRCATRVRAVPLCFNRREGVRLAREPRQRVSQIEGSHARDGKIEGDPLRDTGGENGVR